jgi:class 3 adenylate cyclase
MLRLTSIAAADVSARAEEWWHIRSREEHQMESICAIGPPHHRTIVALDIEMSTNRTDPVKAELRNKIYELFDAALCSAGIHRRHRDRFIDRGDGILALIHPVDKAPKTILLSHVIPALNRLLADYNFSLSGASRTKRLLRVRAVVHAGEVHYDANGCFGEALDVAFRLLDATQVKRALQGAAEPLILVVSGDIYRSVVRHGYDGIDQHAYHSLVRVQIAGNSYPGWIHLAQETVQHQVAELANYRKPA